MYRLIERMLGLRKELFEFGLLPLDVSRYIIEFVNARTLGAMSCTSRQWSRPCDTLWRRHLAVLWSSKFENFGRRRWWLADTTASGHTLGPTRHLRAAIPSPLSGVRLVRELSWRESFEASLEDSKRTYIYDHELTGLAWYIKFRNASGQHLVAFHDDGAYEDGVFFARDFAPCDWGIQRDKLLISTGGAHSITRASDWSWRIRNRFVVLTSRGLQAPRLTHCVARNLQQRTDLNGATCTIEAYDAKRGRYLVLFDEDACPRLDHAAGAVDRGGHRLWLKPPKVRLPVDARVTSGHDEGRVLVAHDDASYTVRLSQDQTKRLSDVLAALT